MKAAVYVRVSTENQALKGESLELQKERILEYIKIRDWKLFKIYEDAGISGGTLERPAFQEMLTDARQKQFDILLVYKIDRLSRSILDFHNTMKLLEKNNIAFVSLTQQFDTSTSMGRLMLAILVDFANFEREINVDRARDSYLSRLKKGVHSGRTPFGYKRINGNLEIDLEKVEIIKKIFDLALRGWTSLRIANELKLTLDLIKSVLTNPFYTGFVCPRRDKYGHRIQNFLDWHEGLHEGIISLEIYKQVMDLRSRPIKGKHPSLFAKMLYCPYCEHNLTAQYKGKRVYYRCSSIGPNSKYCKQSIKEKDLENILLSHIDRVFKLKIPKQKGELSVREHIARIDKKIQKTFDLIDVEGITSDDIKRKIAELNKEKKKILSRKETLDYRKIAETIKTIKNVYTLATLEERQELWRILIDRIIMHKDNLEVHFRDGTKSVFSRKKLMFGGDEGIYTTIPDLIELAQIIS